MTRAIRRVGVAVTVLLLALVAQLSYLQVVSAKRLKEDPRNVRTVVRDFQKPRGEILTSDGQIVARSVKSHDELELQRLYPLGSLFGPVGGYQSFVVGNTGVEAVYNDVLTGRDTKLQVGSLRDLGDLLSDKHKTGNVVLTLSAAAQAQARDALGDQKGSVVALDPRSGAVLAMYSNPSFDPQPLASHKQAAVQAAFNALNADPAQPALPRAWRETYPAGSTFKVVTSSVGLETGTTTPDTPYPTLTELPLPLSTKTISNFGGEQCGGTLVESFVASCNTTFAEVGLDLGEKFPPGTARFGIGESPPLDQNPRAVPSTGPVPGAFKNDPGSFALAGIGQGPVAVTPVQMALVASAIANGGVAMAPHVLAEVRDADGAVVRRVAPRAWKTATTPGVAATVTDMMRQVVERGTGTAAQINGVAVAGKTGTAQVGNSPNPHAWFIAFAPAEAPRVAVAVLVEHGGSMGSDATGGQVAAPIAKQMLELLLGIPRS